MSTPYKFNQTRADFGKAILTCFKKNDWPQSITESVAKEIGIEGGPWASQVSTAINGKLDPKPAFFIAFGIYNAYIHAGDFRKIKDINLRDKLKGSKAFTHNNGRPFDGADFFRLFTGLIEIPKKYKTEVNQFSTEILKEYQKEMVAHTIKIKRQEMLKPKEFWELYLKQPYTKTIKESDLDIINDFLREDLEISKEICLRFGKAYGKCPVIPGLKSISKIKMNPRFTELNQIVESSVVRELSKETKKKSPKVKVS